MKKIVAIKLGETPAAQPVSVRQPQQQQQQPQDPQQQQPQDPEQQP